MDCSTKSRESCQEISELVGGERKETTTAGHAEMERKRQMDTDTDRKRLANENDD